MLLRAGLFILGITAAPSSAATLHQLVEARVKPVTDVPELKSERTWAASGYNPIQFFEYRHGRDFENNQRYYRIPFTDRGGETHTFRIHFKSLKELTTYADSRDLSRKLLDTERLETVNQRQFDAYLDLTNDILNARMLRVLSGRGSELKKSVDQGGQMLGLPDSDAGDLLMELSKLQKVAAEENGVKAQVEPATKLADQDADVSAQALIDNAGALAKRLPELMNQAEVLQIERKNLELKLKRVNNEVGWAEDRKLIDHIDIQRDTLDRSDSFRVAVNIPFLRFDNESRARDQALMVANEHEAERKRQELLGALRRKRAEVFSLGAQVESMRSRLGKTRRIVKKLGSVSDIETRSVLGDFGFELERDLLVQSLRFYKVYLEVLRDAGAFARFSEVNLIDPNWQAFSK